MKLVTKLLSRENLAKKIQKRNKNRIETYTTISTAFKPEDAKIVQDNIDSIARYAERNQLYVAFMPSVRTGAPKMDVYKRGTKTLQSPENPHKTITVPCQTHKGNASLPYGITDNKEFLSEFRKEASKILYKDKEI